MRFIELQAFGLRNMTVHVGFVLLTTGALAFRDGHTVDTLDALSDNHGLLGVPGSAVGLGISGGAVRPSSLVGTLQQASEKARGHRVPLDPLVHAVAPLLANLAKDTLAPGRAQITGVDKRPESRNPHAQIAADQIELAHLLAQDTSKSELKKVQQAILLAPGNGTDNKSKYAAMLALIESVIEGVGTRLTEPASFRRLNPPSADNQQGRSGARIYAHTTLGLLIKSMGEGDVDSLTSLSIERQLQHYLEVEGNTLLSMNLMTLAGSTLWLVSTLVGPVEGVASFDLKGTLITMTNSQGAQGVSKYLTYGRQPRQGDQEKLIDVREGSPDIFKALNATPGSQGISVPSVLRADAAWLVEANRVDFSLLVKVRNGDPDCSLGRKSLGQPSIQDLVYLGVCVDGQTRVWMALIDYLVEYTWKKATENLVKWSLIKATFPLNPGVAGQRTIRAPLRYAERFTKEIPELLFGDVEALMAKRAQLGAQ